MSCLRKIEYRIEPTESYRILRNCSGCGEKRSYVNTGNFRVNANGRRIDVWLIYQCEKCKHTYNLTIMERVRPEEIPEETYKKFLANDKELAFQYGLDHMLMNRNRAEIERDKITYHICREEDCGDEIESLSGECVVVSNPYEVKVRADKLLAEIFEVSRSKVRQMEKEGEISQLPKYVGKEMEVQCQKIN